jgi:hypothetical protein
MEIFEISGFAQHGKDSLADFMIDILSSSEKKCLKIKFGDYLKFVASNYHNWDGKKDARGRELLQKLGTEIARDNHPDIWVNVVIEFLSAFKSQYDFIFIPDCRYENEILKIKESGYRTTNIWINRPNFDNGLTKEQKSHRSETSLLDYPFEKIVINDGNLEDLLLKSKNLLHSLL